MEAMSVLSFKSNTLFCALTLWDLRQVGEKIIYDLNSLSDTKFLCLSAAAANLRHFRSSNILGIDTRPYDPAAFQDTELITEEDGVQHVHLRHLNTVRWRWQTQKDGSTAPQSNARCCLC